MVSFNDVLLVVTGTWRYQYESPARIRLPSNPRLVGKHHSTVAVSTMNTLYSRLTSGDSELHNCQIPVLVRRCNSRVTCAATSTHIPIIFESLLKPGDETLGDSKFQLGMPTFRTADNSTT
ncbi:uncharacterized protein TNCV_1001941 [Trichonephila clavipes]|nr:uncharacterized protein TNCV_1001941 [Trichonephila clavipes]